MLPSSYNNASSMLRSDYGPLERIGAPDSTVYRGRGNDGGFVALRFVHTDDAIVRDALAQVSQTASAIRHPMLAAVGGCQRFAGDALCVVSEYVPGLPLDRWVRANGLPPLRMTVDFVRRLCLGLHVAHQRELTHSALHPGNLMVLQQDTRPGGRIVAKLLDVGVPSWLRVWPPRLAAAQFVAPELLRVAARPAAPGISGDSSTDVYACGALLYFLCTGVAPFECVSLAQLLAASSAARPIPRPSYANSEISSELEDIILTALAIDPSERIESMAELALSLGDVEAQWSESGIRRRDTPDGRKRRMTSPDAVTPVVNLRGIRNAHGSQSSSSSSTATSVTSVTSSVTSAVALPRGVAVAPSKPPESASPPAVIPRPQVAPSGTYPALEWPPKRRRSIGGLALVAVSTLLASFALHRAWTLQDSQTETVKPPTPVIARHLSPMSPVSPVSPALQPAPQPVYPPPFEETQASDPRAAAALATGSLQRARATTFASDRESRASRAEKRAGTRRARERDSQPVAGAAAPSEAQLRAAKTDERELLAEALPNPADQTALPAKRADATPPSFAESAPPEPAAEPAKPAPAVVSLPPSDDTSAHPVRVVRATRSVQIDDVRVRGPLSPSVVRRALERIKPLLQRCVEQNAASSNTRAVQLSTTIDEIGRARASTAHGNAPPALNDCMVAAAGKIVADTPDTGTVKVSWKVAY
ncbi:MAG TPA: protein kinase [Polyangiales bacterium]|nr:protein kinase [Polyangiales bacterium]